MAQVQGASAPFFGDAINACLLEGSEKSSSFWNLSAAAAKEGVHLIKTGMTAHDAGLFLVGMVTAGLVGFLTIKFLLKYLATHALNLFAYYRLALAAVTVAWLATR